MEGLLLPDRYLALYGVANLIALALVVLAPRRPDLARWFFVTLFLGAGVLNILLVRLDPQLYVGYAPLALLALYRHIIAGVFARHIVPIVLGIALGQLAIGILLTRRGRWLRLGGLGGTLFLLAIAPLGPGAAIPAPLLVLVALLLAVPRLERWADHAPAGHVTPTARPAHTGRGPPVRGSDVQ